MQSSQPTTAPSASGLSRGWRVLIILSLCLNVLFLGVVGTMLWRWSTLPGPLFSVMAERGRQGHEAKSRGFGLGRGPLNPHVLASLAPDKRDGIRHIVDAHKPKLQALRHESILARQAAADQLGSDSYTPAAFAASLDRLRAADTALEAEVLSIIQQSAALLSPQERRAVAKAQKEMPRHSPGSGMGPGMGHGQGMGAGRGHGGGPDRPDL